MYQDGGSFAEGYAIGRDTNNNGYGNWGGEWFWVIILLALWGNGNNGFGGFGGNNFAGYEIGKLATTNDVASGFNNSAVLGNQRELQLSVNNGFAGVQQTLCQGFNGVNTSILTTGNAIQSQLADCCCTTQRAIDGVNYNLSKSTCDIIQANTNNTQRILDFLTGEKISSLQAENAALTAQLSNNAQTNTIINSLRPVAQPAYITCSPYESAFGLNKGCGCGCGF